MKHHIPRQAWQPDVFALWMAVWVLNFGVWGGIAWAAGKLIP